MSTTAPPRQRSALRPAGAPSARGLWWAGLRLIGVAVIVLLVEGGGAAPYGIGSPRGPETILLAERFTAGRLAGQGAWGPCVAEPGESLVPRVRCGSPLTPGTPRFRHLRGTAAELLGRLAPDDGAALSRASALWLLRRGNEVDRAVAELERAAARSPNDARVLNDLAVAYLEQGARDQTLEPVLRALDAVERVLARDSTRLEALYNRALIADRLYLVNTARDAWTRYAAVEPDPRWRDEARARAMALAAPADTSWWALVNASPALDSRERRERIERRLARAPSETREFSFALLGRWGEAVLAGRHHEAARLLGWARDIGSATTAFGGDRTVPLALRAIDAASRDSAAIQVLARGHAALDSGYTQFQAPSYESAAQTLARAQDRLAAARSPMAGWAGYFRAAALVGMARYLPADSILRAVASQADTAQPALAGRATWGQGTSRVRRGLYDEASTFYRMARPYVERAREPEYEGTLHALLSESLRWTGRHAAARAEAYPGLRTLSRFSGSIYYNTQLTTVAAEARAEGLRHAALAVMDEKVRVTRALRRHEPAAQALRDRARARMEVGDTAAAGTDLRGALGEAAAIRSNAGRARVTADVQVVVAEMQAGRDPELALHTLREAIEIYRDHQLGVYMSGALGRASAIARRAGNLAAARVLVDEAVRETETLQDSARSPETRATRLETVETVFDEAITVALQENRPDEAFRYLERARAAAWPRGRPGSVPAADAEGIRVQALARRVAGDTVFLEYAVLSDRLVLWTASRHGVRQFSTPVPRDSLARLVDRFARGGYDSTGPGDAGATLFGLLLGPIADDLGGVRHLAVVPDRELNRLPFAALRRDGGGPWLVEHVSISTLPSAAFFLDARDRGRRRGAVGPALVIGEPALDPSLDLDPLPAAADEARAVARLRPPATLLVGAGARADTVVRLLSRSSLLHFAGHAVFNADQPELSYLALAPDGTGNRGRLYAWEIGHLTATNLETVVLSACSTLSPRPTHAGAPAGLAYSFLRAGAPATVSTLWDVRDQTTTPVLVEFHRHVAAGIPPAEALRQAQVAALGSPHPATRSPVAWAAFIYTGP